MDYHTFEHLIFLDFRCPLCSGSVFRFRGETEAFCRNCCCVLQHQGCPDISPEQGLAIVEECADSAEVGSLAGV